MMYIEKFINVDIQEILTKMSRTISPTKIRSNKKGLSGAVTALILVIASVIITLVVVGFAFGLFGAFGGTPTVSQVGSGTMYSNGTVVFTVKSTGTVQLSGAQLVGTPYSAANAQTTLSAGENTLTLTFNIPSSDVQAGSTYTISLALSDGATAEISVIAQ